MKQLTMAEELNKTKQTMAEELQKIIFFFSFLFLKRQTMKQLTMAEELNKTKQRATQKNNKKCNFLFLKNIFLHSLSKKKN